MLKYIKCIILSCLCLSATITKAQFANLKPLKVGDTIPDIPLANLINYKKTQGTLRSEFGGTPLIIDRWNTHCAPCISGLPLMDSIQKENRGQLNILLVDNLLIEHDNVENVKAFFKNNPYAKNVSLPTTAMDTAMKKLFPGEPYQVWIDKNGVVRSISEPEQVTRENVKLFLSNKPLNLVQVKIKEDDPYRNPLNYPLMVIDESYNQGKGKRFYTYISGYDSTSNDVKVHWLGPRVENQKVKIQLSNVDLFELYNYVDFRLEDKLKPRKPYQFIMENPDRFRLMHSPVSLRIPDVKDLKKMYCYEMISADTSIKKAYRIMKDDLDNFFDLESSLESRPMPCYVIKRINPAIEVLKSKGGFSSTTTRDGSISMINENWKLFPTTLNRSFARVIKSQSPYFIPYQVVDETGYSSTYKIDISVPTFSAVWENLPKINGILKRYNLVITKEDRTIDVIVLNKSKYLK